MSKILTLTAVALIAAPPALAHSNPPKLLHPTAHGLRQMALLASDLVEGEGAKYIGAVGKCKAENRAVRKGKPGWKHVRCYMRTSRGYRFTVTWHATNKGTISGAQVVRTL